MDTKIAFWSMVIAGTSIIVSVISALYARKAVRISEKQYNDKLPDFELYYDQNYGFNIGDRRILIFELTIKNKAEFKNTFRAELEINYIREDDTVSKVKMNHNPELMKVIPKKDIAEFPLNIEIDAKTASTKWLAFEQPSHIFPEHRIDKYVMIIKDLSGNTKSTKVLLIKDF